MEVAVAALSWFIQKPLTTFSPSQTDPYSLLKGLGPRLSPNASIYLPSSPDFPRVTDRWSSGTISPSYIGSVEVATEDDVVATVQFANQHDLPFLAQSGGHGMWEEINDFKGGIQIYMRQMNDVEIDGEKAIIGGGAMVSEVIDALYKEWKQAVTGVCPCVSLIGPALGGGHGVLQGRYGLIADNILAARLVLANGTAVTVSDDSHPDLFWAFRGAGHNFGIVTSFELKTYDIPQGNIWTTWNFFFTQDKLEEVYAIANKLSDFEGNHPVELIEWGNFLRIPDIDPVNLAVLYEGTASEAAPFIAPLEALDPVVRGSKVISEYNLLLAELGYTWEAPVCARTYDVASMTLSLSRYNLTALRAFYNIFAEASALPGLGNAFTMLEGYGTRRVKTVPEQSTAVSKEERMSNLLIGGVMVFPRGDANARVFGEAAVRKMDKVLRDGHDEKRDGPLGAYVNYASGIETLEEMYGHDIWRLQKLKALKREYDPHNRFRYYAGIGD